MILVILVHHVEKDREVVERIGGKQNRSTTVMHFVDTQHPRKIRQDKGPMALHVDLLMSPAKTLMQIAQRHRQTMIFEFGRDDHMLDIIFLSADQLGESHEGSS